MQLTTTVAHLVSVFAGLAFTAVTPDGDVVPALAKAAAAVVLPFNSPIEMTEVSKPGQSDIDPLVAEASFYACHLKGGPCAVARRSALDLAEATHNAYAAIEPTKKLCFVTDGDCLKDEYNAVATLEAAAEAWFEKREASPEARRYCYRRGEPCSKAKRGTNSDSFAVEKREAEARQYCYRRGEPCSKVKRAAEAVAEAMAEAHQYCYRRGEPCSKVKRSLEYISQLDDE